MRVTVIFTGCGQVGIDTWVDYHKTRFIPLTEHQQALLEPPEGMRISKVYLEEEEIGTE